MKVYVVMGSWGCDVYDDDLMKIFTDKSDAEVYKHELENEMLSPNTPLYDFIHILERTLCTEKSEAVCTAKITVIDKN